MWFATFFRSRSKNSGATVSDAKQLRGCADCVDHEAEGYTQTPDLRRHGRRLRNGGGREALMMAGQIEYVGGEKSASDPFPPSGCRD